MKAVRFYQYGSPEVLELEEVKVPSPSPKDLLVEVRACGLNPVDTKIRKGELKAMLPVTLPFTPGGDIAGVVREVGSEVTGFVPGDEVFFSSRLDRGGGYGEYCVVEPALVAKKPKELSFVDAAALPVVGLTAVQCLRDYSAIQKGHRVLIHAGAGGLGSFAIQYAKYCGAEVFTTGRKTNHAYMRALGADHTIDYTTDDFVEICQRAGGMDITFETLGGLTYPKSLLATKEGGVVPCVVNPPDADTLALSEKRRIKTAFLLLVGKPADLDEIAKLVVQKIIRPSVAKVISLADVVDGHRQLESGRTQGKWVIQY